ncbi:hypothetical protein M1523_03945 [Patescibacteria group bacterium]|nr:hypothetical protein [Patescibacteria group bacterium]MCL5091845.1 hypothetical protein [Patescibacteria group bacterium]
MHRKTFLFFPVEIGLAHIVRPLAVAEALHRRGHRVIFALSRRKQAIFSATPVRLVDVKNYAADDSQLDIKSFSNYQFLKQAVNQELELIRKYKPDTVVIDFRISALAAGLIAGKPCVFLSLGESLPEGSYLPNPGLPKIIYRLFKSLSGPIYHQALIHYLRPLMAVVKEHQINIAWRDWFRTVTFILPEPAFYLPANAKDLHLHYVAPVSWSGFKNTTPAWLSNIKRDGKTIYLTFGGTGFDKRKLIDLSVLLVKSGYRVVVSSGTIADPEDFPKINGVFVARFLPGALVTKKVDLVVCHGGYGTMIEAVQNGTPVLAIPFNPDQIIHGKRMEELGVGRCLFSLNLSDLAAVFTFNWKQIEDKGRRLEVRTIVRNVKEMFADPDVYRGAMARFKRLYPMDNGADQTADLLEKGARG